MTHEHAFLAPTRGYLAVRLDRPVISRAGGFGCAAVWLPPCVGREARFAHRAAAGGH